MKKSIILKILPVILLSVLLIGLVSCGLKKNTVTYNDTKFEGSGIKGVSKLLDMVGYDSNLNAYEYGEDGSVAMVARKNVPLRYSRTSGGFRASISVERKDGEFDIMTSSWNTGSLYVKTENIRHRIFVVGIDSDTSYLIVAGTCKQAYGNNYDYFERRYVVPLKNYCTGAPLDLEVVYYKNAYYITMKDDTQSVFKKIEADTPFTEVSGVSSEMTEFFEDGERILGLETLDVPVRFSNVVFKTGNKVAKAAVTDEIHNITVKNKNKNKGSVEVATKEVPKGEAVVIDVKPNEGCYLKTFKVNGMDCKGFIEMNDEGKYQYTIVGIQSDTVIEAKFASGEETKYLVTGNFTYTSGDYNGVKNSCENEGDTVSVKAGMYQGTVKEDGRFEIELPKGVFNLQLQSEHYPAATKKIVVTNEPVEVGEIQFKRLKFTTDVSYNADDSLTMSTKLSSYVFDEAAVEDGWVVQYTVQGAVGGWFNTGGLYMKNEDGSWDAIFIYSQGGKAEVVMIESDQRSDNGPVYRTSYDYENCLESIDVTIAYYRKAFHVLLGDTYACSIDATTTLDTTQGTLTEEFFANKPRLLGLKNYDSAATFSNLKFERGVDAVWKVILSKDVNIKASASAGGTLSMISNGKEIPMQSVQTIGTNLVCEISTQPGYYIDTFTVNKKDTKAMIKGPFEKDGKNVYLYDFKAAKGGQNIAVTFTKNKPTLQTVSGSYTYAEGLSQSPISVTSGGYVGTVKDGKYSISLPTGTHIITLKDANGVYATKEVAVQYENVSDADIVMKALDYEGEKNVNVTKNGFTVIRSGGFSYKYFPNELVASDAFAVSYTVKGTGDGWYNGGGLFFEKNGVKYTIFVKAMSGKATIMLLQPNVGSSFGTANYSTDYAYGTNEQELKVTVVYYNETLYIQLGNGEYHKFQTPSDMSQYADQIDSTYFSSGYRKLGFAALDENATFEDVSYVLGNENVRKLYADVIDN